LSNSRAKCEFKVRKYYRLVLICHHNVLYSDTLRGLQGGFLHKQLSSSQSESSTHLENILYFVILEYYKMLYLLKPELMIFCDNICFMNAFDTLNYVKVWIDDDLWDLK